MYRWGSTSLRATSQLPRELSQFPQRSLSPAVATQIDAADCTAWGVWQTAYTCSVSVVALVVSGSFCDPMDCIACQAPLSMGFSRQEYWRGLPLPSPGDLPDPRNEPQVSCTVVRRVDWPHLKFMATTGNLWCSAGQAQLELSLGDSPSVVLSA